MYLYRPGIRTLITVVFCVISSSSTTFEIINNIIIIIIHHYHHHQHEYHHYHHHHTSSYIDRSDHTFVHCTIEGAALMICWSHGIHSLSTIRPDVHRNLLDMMLLMVMIIMMMMMIMMEMMVVMMSKVIPCPCQFTTYSVFESRQVVP